MRVDFMSPEQAGSLAVPDVYYSSAYGSSAALIDGGTWECAVGEGGAYAFPYLRRSVPGNRPDGAYDIVTPYGYGGVARHHDTDLDGLACFRRSFLRHSRDRGLVAEFMRTNPFDTDEAEMRALGVDSFRSHTTLAVRRFEEPEEHWNRAQGRHRTAVRKAERGGVTISRGDVQAIGDAASAFRRLYSITMDRVEAGRRLRLSDEYFRALSSGLEGNVVLLEATLNGEVCAAALFLTWGVRAHYHLSGATVTGLSVGATNAILDTAVRTVLPVNGVLHLGGGLAPGDGLERFKRSVSTESRTVYFAQTVVNVNAYDALRATAPQTESGYFPAYREDR